MSLIDKIKGLFKGKGETSEKPSVADLKEKFKELSRDCIDVEFGGEIQSGALSRFGGKPSVPQDFKWPYFETDSFDDPTGEVKERPLAFLAQFDCAELAEFDGENVLPHTGVLSFFYSVESNRWGFDPADNGCSRVYWFENADGLTEAEYPDGLSDSYRFPPLAVKLSVKESYPDFEELPEGYNSDEYEDFYETFNVDCDSITKFLGWADTIQSEMSSECELVSRGYNLGGSQKIPQEVCAEAAKVAGNWRLLFQMDTVESDGFELMFGDCGRIYFWIKKDDLAARRFDRAWLILQCG